MADMDDFCWYEFWRSPWVYADPSWLEGPAWLADALAVGRYHHAAISAALSIPNHPAPPPMLPLLNHNSEQRNLSCILAGEIIAPGAARKQLSAQQLLWCRRTGAALRTRPPVERDKAQIIGLAALRAWQTDAWSRLCWLYDRNAVEQANWLTLPPLKSKTQETLWQAVIWQVKNDQ